MTISVFRNREKIKFEYTDDPVDVYSGTFYVKGTIHVKNGSALDLQTINGELSYQACSAVSCLAPEKVPVDMKLTIVPPGTQTAQINQDIFSCQSENRYRGLKI